MRFDDGERIATRVAFRTVVTIAVEAGAVVPLRTVLARRAILAGAVVAVVAGTLVPRPVIPGSIVARTLVAGTVVSGPVVAGAVVAPRAVTAALAIAVAVTVLVARALVPLAILGTIVAGAVVALLLLPVSGTLVAAVFACLPGLGGFAGFGGSSVGGFGLGLGAFILEIDVEARGEVVAAEDFAGRAGGLHGAQQAEIVLGVLQVVLAEDAVAGRRGVPGELLVLLEDVLGVAADLGALGAVRIERPVGVLGLRLTAAATTSTAATITAALALHTLEISHYLITVLVSLRPGPLGSACASLQRDRAPGPF